MAFSPVTWCNNGDRKISCTQSKKSIKQPGNKLWQNFFVLLNIGMHMNPTFNRVKEQYNQVKYSKGHTFSAEPEQSLLCRVLFYRKTRKW